MKKHTISYDEVKQFVQNLPDGAEVGICGDAYHCVIAHAVASKYPKFKSVYVMPWANMSIRAYGARDAEYHVTAEDNANLVGLAERFDRLDGNNMIHATKEQVLPLFK